MVLGVLLGMLVMFVVPDQGVPNRQDLVVSSDHLMINQQDDAVHSMPSQPPAKMQEEPDPIAQELESLKPFESVDVAKPKQEKTVQANIPSVVIVEKEVIQKPVSLAMESAYGIALVLDDVGYDLTAVERILALSVPVAISILPGSPFAQQAAALAKQSGQVVMLHLPMQPTDVSLRMNDDFLQATMPEQVVRDTFLRHLDSIPYVEGVNNHMGSKLTQLDAHMNWVMQVCREKSLFFIDSRTSAKSVVAKVAEKAGVAWASRSIFLDHDMSLESMQKAWQRARTCAKKKLACIVIAHPRAKTVTFLENYLNKDDAANMVSVKDLLKSTYPHTQTSSVSRLP